MPSRASKPPPSFCPACGAEVPEKALACPECGADHTTGWNQETTAYDGIDLPDTEFDYDAYLKREFSASASTPASNKKVWTAVVILVIFGIILLLFLGRG